MRFGSESPLAAVIEWLGRLPSRTLTAVSVALVGVMGVADFWTSRDVSVAVAYVLPVFLAAAAGGRSSTRVAAIATLTWTGIEVLTKVGEPIPPGIVIWNLLARFAVLWIVGALGSHLAEKLAEATDLSRTDALTSLPNARSFRESADEEIERMRQTGTPLTAAYLDVDGFKAMNDTNGHAAGDQVLITVARVLESSIGEHGRVARLGGDEFAVLLPGTGLDEALGRLGWLHHNLLDATRQCSPPLGFSIGAVTFDAPPHDAADLVERADRVMYAVKHHARNTVRGERAQLAAQVG
ncbi:diguanylate cyclase (GGDEF)-like protein [Actinoplanes lutulentus]|uniref:Diguanylate cyclase (GGDEF)-like protein n=1 Tax=Actinoplanes lutulentus TaxID=1287878 RepID=A0A327ZKK2_9ACTN|nr:GGDEF domain-containing protein [Actinoplanes lutulentus]MBB2943972.1 diguanylate cyclase (GGDEF)-like protein [Actinoplanes lutulentus]RAK42795.1 diguanylate cyclase (GGDEF)-like protein [Actinoplanes lutulentus]